MIKRSLCFLVVVVLVGAATAQSERSSCPEGAHTLYSNTAATLDGAFARPVVLLSPNRKKKLSVRTVEDPNEPDGLRIDYAVAIGSRTLKVKLAGMNGEVAWSPDSKAFAVTQTKGGGGIGSRVYVFYVDDDGMRKLDVSVPIEKHFGRPVKCEVPVPPNTGFIRWGNDSSTLLVAAEIVPVSICQCSGTYRVYEMRLPSLVIARTYTQIDAKKRFWRDLGCELRDADDGCVHAVERYGRRGKTP
jgi:hypothetical protein